MITRTKIRVYILGTQGLPARYGGFETLVDRLTRNKKSAEIEYVVACQRTKSKTKLRTYNDAELFYLPFSANGIQSIFFDIAGLFAAALRGDAVLLLGTSGAIMIPLIRIIRPRLRVITNIAGLEWSRSKWGPIAKWFLKVSEAFAVRFSTTVIADNQKLVRYVSETYGRQPIFVAYGGDRSYTHLETPNDPILSHEILSHDYFVMVARCQQDNNFEMILDAFSKADQKIVIISNFDDNPYGAFLRQQYGNERNMLLIGPIYNHALLSRIREKAVCYVHGHSAGGTNPTLVEALWFGNHILAFRNGFNEETAQNAAQYFSNSSELRKLISNTRYEPGGNVVGLNLGKSLYKWDLIVQAYEKELLRD